MMDTDANLGNADFFLSKNPRCLNLRLSLLRFPANVHVIPIT